MDQFCDLMNNFTLWRMCNAQKVAKNYFNNCIMNLLNENVNLNDSEEVEKSLSDLMGGGQSSIENTDITDSPYPW